MAPDDVTPRPEPTGRRTGTRPEVTLIGSAALDGDRDQRHDGDDRWRGLVVDALDHLGLDRTVVVSLSFVGAEQMAELNQEHLGGDGPTDVLSFPIDGDPGLAPVTREPPPSPGSNAPPWMLGDIVICPEVAAANAADHAGSYPDEIALLIVHGLLHLLDMDHADDVERQAMQARERDLLDATYGALRGDPWGASTP